MLRWEIVLLDVGGRYTGCGRSVCRMWEGRAERRGLRSLGAAQSRAGLI